MAKTKEVLSILLLDSNGSNLPLVRPQFPQKNGSQTRFEVTRNLQETIDKLKENSYQVILVGDSSPNEEDLTPLLTELSRRKISTPLILMVNPEEERQAQQALRLGVSGYVLKTESQLKDFPRRIQDIFRTRQLGEHHEELEEQIAGTHDKLFEVNEKFRKLSIKDDLTQLYNHRFLQEKLEEEFTRAVRYHHPLSCMMVDLDQFRHTNEALGHVLGDEILKEAAAILVESCRTSDLISRFGGEEFAVILPHVDYQGASELAERLRCLFAERTFLADSNRLSLTVSIGVSCFPDDAIKHRAELLDFADRALFRAKAAGRNRVSLYRDHLPTLAETLPHLKISEDKVLDFQRRLADIADAARKGYVESSKALIAALESKDRFTAGHAGSVARLSMQVAEAMGLSLDEAEVVEHAGLLHDIGKICISDDILLKPERLTLAEYEAMKQHPYLGYRIVKPIKFLQQEASLILYHHEWFNGQGYPCRLARNEIPLGSRIVAVIDSYDTMRHAGGRYKKTVSVEEAVNELIACSGVQFDPEVVQAFIQVLLMRKELNSEAYNKKRLQEVLETAYPH